MIHLRGAHWVICVLPREVGPLLQQVHDEKGHFSTKIVLERIRYRVFWPRMAADIRDYIEGCIQCARFAAKQYSQPLHPVTVLEPGQLFGMDYIGPLPLTPRGYRFILNVNDYFSRYHMPKKTKNNNKEDTIECLKEVFDDYTTPIAVYIDQGQHFDNAEIRDFLKSRGVSVVYSGSGASKSTGMIEVANKILQLAIKKAPHPNMVFSKDDYEITSENWDLDLNTAKSNVNERCIMHLMTSPKQIFMGITGQTLGGLEDEYPSTIRSQFLEFLSSLDKAGAEWISEEDESFAVMDFMHRRELAREQMHDRDVSAKQDMKARYDRRVREYHFTPGQAVMLYHKERKGKLEPHWRGPFVVTGHANEFGVTYKLRQVNGKKIRGQFHGDDLRKFRLREGYLIPPFEAAFPDYQTLRAARPKARKTIAKVSFDTTITHMGT